MLEKIQIRKNMRQQRLALSQAFVEDAAQAIFNKLQRDRSLLQCQRVAVYWPDENEVDTQLLIDWLLQREVEVYLPVVQQQQMQFHLFKSDSMQKNRFGIVQPDPLCCPAIEVGCLDTVVLPLVAFDPHGYRIGRGGGYYDRALAATAVQTKRPALLALAYEFQIIADCQPQPHDIAMDCIVTESACYPA